MFRHCCFFLFRSHSATTRSSDVRFDLSSSSGDTVTRRASRMIRNLMGPCNRSGHRNSTAKKLVYGSAKISGEFDPETSHACPSK